MNERMPPEGQPEPAEGASPGAEAPASGPIGWPERPAGADAPTEATPPPADAGPSASSEPVATIASQPPPPPPAAQPAVQWQAPAPAAAVGVRAPRTTLSAIGGVTLLALGIIGMLFGVLLLAGAALVSQLATDFVGEIPGLPEDVSTGSIVGGVVAFFAVLVIAYSVAYILGGIGVLRSAEWGRWLGIVVAAISGLIWAGGLNNASDGFGFSLVLFLLHLYVFVVLIFRWREPMGRTA